jgi:hypothetical protein
MAAFFGSVEDKKVEMEKKREGKEESKTEK